MIQTAYTILFGIVFAVLTLCLLALLVRSMIGPGVTVRVICVNMTGTAVTGIFALLAAYFSRGWLFDVCLLYVLVSFLSVVILSKVYMRKSAADEVRVQNGESASDLPGQTEKTETDRNENP